MAKVIGFYVPTSFHQKVKWTSSPVRNEVIELCPHDEGETKIIAVFEEVVRVEQYLVLKEEVWILRGRATLDSLASTYSSIKGNAASTWHRPFPRVMPRRRSNPRICLTTAVRRIIQRERTRSRDPRLLRAERM
jgi:hypothetical protein